MGKINSRLLVKVILHTLPVLLSVPNLPAFCAYANEALQRIDLGNVFNDEERQPFHAVRQRADGHQHLHVDVGPIAHHLEVDPFPDGGLLLDTPFHRVANVALPARGASTASIRHIICVKAVEHVSAAPPIG